MIKLVIIIRERERERERGNYSSEAFHDKRQLVNVCIQPVHFLRVVLHWCVSNVVPFSTHPASDCALTIPIATGYFLLQNVPTTLTVNVHAASPTCKLLVLRKQDQLHICLL